MILYTGAMTSPALSDVISCGVLLFACNNSRMSGRIVIKFGMEATSFEADPKSYLLISYSW